MYLAGKSTRPVASAVEWCSSVGELEGGCIVGSVSSLYGAGYGIVDLEAVKADLYGIVPSRYRDPVQREIDATEYVGTGRTFDPERGS